MRFTGTSLPYIPSIVIQSKVLTLPNQSLSLKEIIERFTRNEPLPIGRNFNYHESDTDLEKLAHLDLVDRAEFVEMMKAKQTAYHQQQREAEIQRRAEIIAKQKAEAEKNSSQEPAK